MAFCVKHDLNRAVEILSGRVQGHRTGRAAARTRAVRDARWEPTSLPKGRTGMARGRRLATSAKEIRRAGRTARSAGPARDPGRICLCSGDRGQRDRRQATTALPHRLLEISGENAEICGDCLGRRPKTPMVAVGLERAVVSGTRASLRGTPRLGSSSSRSGQRKGRAAPRVRVRGCPPFQGVGFGQCLVRRRSCFDRRRVLEPSPTLARVTTALDRDGRAQPFRTTARVRTCRSARRRLPCRWSPDAKLCRTPRSVHCRCRE